MSFIIALYIITIILALAILILSLRASINIVLDNELFVYLRILFIKIRLFPSKKKKFDPKKHERKQNKKANKPKVVLKELNANSDQELGVLDKINSFKDMISVIFKAFGKYLHVKLAKIHITVATGDAAQTAILYGAVSGAVACIIEIIDNITNLKKIKSSSVLIAPDFVSQKSEVKINITLSLSVYGALVTLAKSLWRYVILKNKS